MRFGIDARTLNNHFPGVGRYVHHLTQGLAASLREADRLFVLVDSSHQESRFDLSGLDEDQRTEMLAGGSPFSFRAPREARRWVASRRLDVLHAPYFLGVRRADCPIVLTWHDAIPLSYPASMPSFWQRQVFRASAVAALRQAERVVTPSRASRDELIRLLATPAEKVDVVPHAAAEHFRPLPREQSAAAVERLGLHGPYVLCVAGPRPHKNLEGLLEAWSALPVELIRDRTLVLVGPDDGRFPAPRRRREELARRRRVAWLPSIGEQDLPALYSAADVYVQPSFVEGFGLPVIEAMACGTAVACADIDGLRETVGNASNAELFAPESSDSIAHCLARLLSEPGRRRQIAERGRRRAGELSWQKTAERMLEIYRKAAQRA